MKWAGYAMQLSEDNRIKINIIGEAKTGGQKQCCLRKDVEKRQQGPQWDEEWWEWWSLSDSLKRSERVGNGIKLKLLVIRTTSNYSQWFPKWINGFPSSLPHTYEHKQGRTADCYLQLLSGAIQALYWQWANLYNNKPWVSTVWSLSLSLPRCFLIMLVMWRF